MANFSGVRCDCCGRIKGESNHWHQIGASFYEGRWWVELGDLQGACIDGPWETRYAVHDLCGEQCLWKHIGKLLKINPASVEVEG